MPWKVYYEVELVVDNKNRIMARNFLSRLMSQKYAAEHDLFVLGTRDRTFDTKKIHATAGVHSLLATVPILAFRLKGVVDLYSVEELRTVTVILLRASGCTKKFFRTCVEAV
jgi:hypothetical protein